MSRWLVLIMVALSLTGCLYRPDLRQGNDVNQQALNELTPNLTKNQVQQIMGNPALTPVFEVEEWNYTYAYRDGKHRNKPLDFETITLYFKDGKLQSYSSKTWHPANLPARKN